MKEKMYVADSEFDGSCMGTLEDILEWVSGNGVDLLHCCFFEVGKEIQIKLQAVEL